MGEAIDTRLITTGLNLLADATTARVVAGFRNAEIESILLKGRANRAWLDRERLSSDVDLLIDPKRVTDAERVLRSLGFERLGSLDVMPGDRPYHASNWATPDGVEIDLHRHVVGLGTPATEAWEILLPATEDLTINGEPIHVLAPAARTLHLALHAAQHGARERRPVEDLERALAVLPAALWHDAASLAHRLRAEAAFAAGLRLTFRGRRLADQLDLPYLAPVGVALRASSPPPMTGGFEWLAGMPGPGARVRFVVRKLVPPPEWMRAWKPIARRGKTGLAASYLWRPIWLASHSVPAWRAWRRLRRNARQ